MLAAVAALAARRVVLSRRHRTWNHRAVELMRAGRPEEVPPPPGPCLVGLVIAVGFEVASVVFLLLWLVRPSA
jgi:hypothetical protein